MLILLWILIETSPGFVTTLGLLVLLGAGLWALYRLVNWRSIDFVITSDRVIYRSGVFAKRGIEIPLNRVNNVNFSQGILERMVGAGNLMIESGGEQGQSHFTDIHDPQNVQRTIHQQIEAQPPSPRRRVRRIDADASAAPVATPAAADSGVGVAGELEKLEGLLQRGTITQAQFEDQKRKLLGG